MTDAEFKTFGSHKAGTYKMRPFCDSAMKSMLSEFYIRLTGNAPKMYRPIGSYKNIISPVAHLMLDGREDTYWQSGQRQKKGHWIGLDLCTVQPVSEVYIRQGRNDVDDSDFYDNAIVEASADGMTWTALTEPLVNRYVISWKGEPVNARYVRLRRLDSKRKNDVSIRNFEVNPVRPESLSFRIESAEPELTARIFDGNPSSTYTLAGSRVTFGRPTASDTLTLLMGKKPDITVEQLDADGSVIATEKSESPFLRISLQPETAGIRLSGTATIHEVL